MSTVEWIRVSDSEIQATISNRLYAIYRQQLALGLRYCAWCEWRGEFVESEIVSASDRAGRECAVEDLKAECHYDAFVGGVSIWNWQ